MESAHRYKCGLRANQLVRLLRKLPITDSRGEVVGVHLAGKVWRVLDPWSTDPVVLLQRPDGHMHIWDDDQTIFEWFEVVDEVDAASRAKTPMPPLSESETLDLQEKLWLVLMRTLETMPIVGWWGWAERVRERGHEDVADELERMLFGEASSPDAPIDPIDLSDPSNRLMLKEYLLSHEPLLDVATDALWEMLESENRRLDAEGTVNEDEDTG